MSENIDEVLTIISRQKSYLTVLDCELLLLIIFVLCTNHRREFGLKLERILPIFNVITQGSNFGICTYDSLKKCLSGQSSVNDIAHFIRILDREETILLLARSRVKRSKALENFQIFDLGLEELAFIRLFHRHCWLSLLFTWLLDLFRT